ncbi:MAG TPA: hypothetical protein VGG06_26470 [Thermoanaerobaculia bacterium]|jgi:ABC-type phosphate transport system substrate-binding protein
MKKLILLSGIVLGLVLALWAAAQSSGFKVIVHQDNPTAGLSAKDVSNLLLKKKTKWDGSGIAADPIDLDGGSTIREAFSERVHGRSASSIKSYWQRQIFSGREVPPPEVRSDAEVIAFVRRTPGAIGYVSSDARLDGVKELRLVN